MKKAFFYLLCVLLLFYSPLGPFVPAPPEFAMQMLRDQGGSFEGNGGTRGRKGRLGPSLGGSGPILSLPTAFPRDPRHIRRSVVSTSHIKVFYMVA